MIFSNIFIGTICFISSCQLDTNNNRKLIGKLVDEVQSKITCGVIKIGVAHKFVFVDSKNQETKDTVKVVCICPEEYGHNFFKKYSLYRLIIGNNLDSLKDCYVLDNYPSQKLKTWVLLSISNY